MAISLDIGKFTIQKWLHQYRQEINAQAPQADSTLTDEQRELQELRKKKKPLRMERDILKRASALLDLGILSYYHWISQLAKNKQVSNSHLCKPFSL